MSAIAFIITPHKTFLYSDGLAIDNNGVEWHNNRKCFKINDHLGVMAVGRWRTGLSEEIIEKITRKGCKTAREAAQIAAPMMRAGLDGICFDDPENPKCSAVLWTFGFEGGGYLLHGGL